MPPWTPLSSQKPAVYDSPLSLAETASIFSEMLLSEKIRTELTTEEYKEFLNEKLSDTFATIFRQIQYIAFEKHVHEAVFAGQNLPTTISTVCGERTGKDVRTDMKHDVEAENESGWSMIPHIFATPFYCYAYAFGISSYSRSIIATERMSELRRELQGHPPRRRLQTSKRPPR